MSGEAAGRHGEAARIRGTLRSGSYKGDSDQGDCGSLDGARGFPPGRDPAGRPGLRPIRPDGLSGAAPAVSARARGAAEALAACWHPSRLGPAGCDWAPGRPFSGAGPERPCEAPSFLGRAAVQAFKGKGLRHRPDRRRFCARSSCILQHAPPAQPPNGRRAARGPRPLPGPAFATRPAAAARRRGDGADGRRGGVGGMGGVAGAKEALARLRRRR